MIINSRDQYVKLLFNFSNYIRDNIGISTNIESEIHKQADKLFEMNKLQIETTLNWVDNICDENWHGDVAAVSEEIIDKIENIKMS